MENNIIDFLDKKGIVRGAGTPQSNGNYITICELIHEYNSKNKAEKLKEILDYIDSFHGTLLDFWIINMKIRDKVEFEMKQSKKL